MTNADRSHRGTATARILVVDDAPFVRNVLDRLLTAAGFRCHSVADGDAALAAAASDRFDLVMTDLNLPGIDGLDLLAMLRTGRGPNRGTPAVLLTGALPEELIVVAEAVGADAIITKPIDPGEVIATIRRLTRPSPLPPTSALLH